MADLIITSPLRGWAAPLAEVPDPVFAERMLGDGVAIHALDGTVHAPCDGEVVTLHAARHAITLRSDEGAEILIHIGLETVALAGEGFTALIEQGQRVARGDPLIAFDLDGVSQRATSLVTPVIVTNPERFTIARRVVDQSVGACERLMTLTPIEAARQAWADEGGALQRTVTLALVHGIHARPAARIGECARSFEADLHLINGEKRADVRSPVGLLALGAKLGDRLVVDARGRDAEAALDAIAALLESGMDERPDAAAPARAPSAALPEGQLAGVTASPGLALGKALRLVQREIAVEHDGAGVAEERTALDAAIASVRDRIAAATAGPGGGVMRAHLALIDDPALIEGAAARIGAGRSAGFAWRGAIRDQAERLRETRDARLIERIDDLIDLERQVLLEIAGRADALPAIPAGAILLARDLLPSQFVALDAANLAGLCLERGGPTSHVAILAAGLGLPMLVAMGAQLGDVADGTMLVLDADAARLHVDPAPQTIRAIEAKLTAREANRAAALASAEADCHSADGTRIEVFANLGSLDDARLAIANGAEGSGLLRTEFLFLDRDDAPGEDEQAEAYQAIADAMGGRPVIVRLLDVGGDKPAPYLALGAEENPALGLRGIRVGLANPDLLETQVRAILRVAPPGQCRIMVPMVASVAELAAVRAVVERVRGELGISAPVELGVMVETPAAAITADLLAAEADFLSIGTNDLTQYALAMDRGNAAVAGGIDALHPAVLRLIARTCELASREGKWTGVCGGLASDPLGIPFLIGLGVTELSVTPAFVPEAKALVRRLTLESCRAHAQRALALPSASEIRALARSFEEDLR